MDDVIIHLGYAAIFVGTFLEGESILALGGLATEHGYLSFPAVVGVAVLGGFLGDQFFFFVGRRYGDRVLVRFPFCQGTAGAGIAEALGHPSGDLDPVSLRLANRRPYCVRLVWNRTVAARTFQ